MEKYKDGKDDVLDIINADGTPTGESKTYTEVHVDGLLHKTAHIWFMNSKGELLLQKRSKQVRAYPEYWDNSASGHIVSPESSIEGAQKEIEEELGITVPLADIKYLFTLPEHAVLNEGAHTENALNDIYLVRSDLEISEFKVAKDEADGIRWISKQELEQWIDGREEKLGEKVTPHIKEEYKRLIDII